MMATTSAIMCCKKDQNVSLHFRSEVSICPHIYINSTLAYCLNISICYGILTSHHEIRASKMRETGSTNLATVWTVGAVGHEIHRHLALGGLYGRVSLAWRDGVAFGEELKTG